MGVPISESKEKTPLKLPVPMPKLKASSSSHDTNKENDAEGGEEALEAKKESEEEGPVAEQPQGPMDLRVQKMISEWTTLSYKDFGDYSKNNYMLHLDNARLKA